MSPKALAIFNNAKVFLSDSEMQELLSCIEKEYGAALKPAKKEIVLPGWTLESVTEELLRTHFRQPSFKNNNVHKQQIAETP